MSADGTAVTRVVELVGEGRSTIVASSGLLAVATVCGLVLVAVAGAVVWTWGPVPGLGVAAVGAAAQVVACAVIGARASQ